MKDKDMTERSVLAEVFVDATLQLCLFHGTACRHAGHGAGYSGRDDARQFLHSLRQEVCDVEGPAASASR